MGRRDLTLILQALMLSGMFVTLLLRAERVAENELTDAIPGMEGRILTVNKISAGGIYDFVRTERARFGLDGLASRYLLPAISRPNTAAISPAS